MTVKQKLGDSKAKVNDLGRDESRALSGDGKKTTKDDPQVSASQSS